ncbi:hypothetical protein QM088_26820 [Klebsiella pneumoniae]|nr:hypothetical protein [Klebsiella pneumoniae]MDV5545195.1 hypothetical protein [Klebsiella pneumoniae]
MVRIANQVRKLFLGENGEDGQISVTMSTDVGALGETVSSVPWCPKCS